MANKKFSLFNPSLFLDQEYRWSSIVSHNSKTLTKPALTSISFQLGTQINQISANNIAKNWIKYIHHSAGKQHHLRQDQWSLMPSQDDSLRQIDVITIEWGLSLTGINKKTGSSIPQDFCPFWKNSRPIVLPSHISKQQHRQHVISPFAVDLIKSLRVAPLPDIDAFRDHFPLSLSKMSKIPIDKPLILLFGGKSLFLGKGGIQFCRRGLSAETMQKQLLASRKRRDSN